MNEKNLNYVNNINDVTVQGIIVHKFVAPKIVILTVKTKTSTNKFNFPKVLFFGELKDKVEKEFNNGDHVCITGNIQSSKPRPGIKNQSLVSIFGESIETSHSMMEQTFNINIENSYKPYANIFELAGLVTRIECPVDNMFRIIIMTKKNNHLSFIPTIFYTKEPEKVLKTIHVNDYVYALGMVQTPRKENNGETKYYENYVLSEIAIQKPNEEKQL